MPHRILRNSSTTRQSAVDVGLEGVRPLIASTKRAIQNARLYERAEIYAAELEALIGKQGQWQARKTQSDS